MSVDASLAGRTFPPTQPYDVTERAVGDFAAATGTPYTPGGPAPATFPIVVAFAAMQELMADPEVGIELHHVVHGQQRFVHERPVTAGDRLSGVELGDGSRIDTDAVVVGPRFRARAEPFAALGLHPVPHPTGLGAVIEVDDVGATSVAGVASGSGITDQSDTSRVTTTLKCIRPSVYSIPALIQCVSSMRSIMPAWS